jgi:phage baseplate assembly protein W
MSRAEKFTSIPVTPTYYSDFLMDFDKNPVTGSLAVANNDEALKNSLKNLLLTNRGERPYNIIIGSRIRSLLFEPFTPDTISLLRELISETIKFCEPRVVVEDIRIAEDIDRNGIYITIVFSMINIPKQSVFEFFFSRVR